MYDAFVCTHRVYCIKSQLRYMIARAHETPLQCIFAFRIWFSGGKKLAWQGGGQGGCMEGVRMWHRDDTRHARDAGIIETAILWFCNARAWTISKKNAVRGSAVRRVCFRYRRLSRSSWENIERGRGRIQKWNITLQHASLSLKRDWSRFAARQ